MKTLQWDRAEPVSRQLCGQQCGVVLGGIGSGGFEIWDDGRFHTWQIFNNGTFTGGRFRTPLASQMPPGGFFFAIRTLTDGQSGLWRLHLPDYTSGEWIEEPYHVPELRFPESIDFFARQPFARLDYGLGNCPVNVSLQADTPLTIHDLDASAWPVANFQLQLHNTTDKAVSVAAIGSLANCVGGTQDDRFPRHEVVEENSMLHLFFPSDGQDKSPDVGSMSLSVCGPGEQLSHCRLWSAIDINPALFWGQLQKDNRLLGDASKIVQRMKLAETAADLGWRGPDGQVTDLAEPDRERLAAELRQFSEAQAIEEFLGGYQIAGKTSKTYGRDLLLETVLRRLYARRPFFGSVARTHMLGPGEEVAVPFLLTWHFPFHVTNPLARGANNSAVEAAGPVHVEEHCECSDKCHSTRPPGFVGHRYNRFGGNALEIATSFAQQRDELQQRSAVFTDALYNGSLPTWLCDAINAQLTSLVTNTWYIEDGRLGLWPGSGCCGFAEIGTGFFATIPLILFFPQASMAQLEMLLNFQAEDGRVPHALAGSFDETTVYYDDDYLKIPLQVYRDWIWTGDEAYLERVWPRLLKLLEACRRLDLDGDGIPDMRGQNQDYDQWLMFGLGIYSAAHWPVMLRAMAQMGRYLGNNGLSDQWENEAKQAAEKIDTVLWRGDRYSLYYDRARKSRCDALLINNLCGEWYARMTGLSPSLPGEHILRNLQAVYEHNHCPGMGTRNGWFPPEERREIGTRDWHWDTCWLGAEYAVASHMIYEGLVEQGLSVCREAHLRHHRQGLRYNHFECGEHYTRALSVWSVLLALQGFHWDAPEGHLTFDPKITPQAHRSIMVLPDGWGVVNQTLTTDRGEWTIQLEEGEMLLRSVKLCRPPLTAQLNGQAVDLTREEGAGRFKRNLAIRQGDKLEMVLDIG